MSLRPTHRGYAYQDLVTAIRLVDVMLGRTHRVVVDTKAFTGDRFDDVRTEWTDAPVELLQLKHSASERSLDAQAFRSDKRGLRLDLLFTSAWQHLARQPDLLLRVAVRDSEPTDALLRAVLRPLAPDVDPGPLITGTATTRLGFDADALLTSDTWSDLLTSLDEGRVRSICAALCVEVALPPSSLDMRQPGLMERVLMRRAADELGAGREPNRDRSPEEVAFALIEAATAARAGHAEVDRRTLRSRLDLVVDFGAVRPGHVVDPSVEIDRPDAEEPMLAMMRTAAQNGDRVILTGAPGTGKSWLCEQVAQSLLAAGWIVARHHCWLGVDDPDRQGRVLTQVVIGSLLRQLEEQAPDAFADLRPRFGATREALSAALSLVRAARASAPIALIVDGLDHVDRVVGRRTGGAFGRTLNPAAAMVAELDAVSLPEGVALLLASQPGQHLSHVSTRDLTVPPLSRDSVDRLAARFSLSDAIRVASGTDRVRAAVDLVHRRSGGNPLYATYLLRQATATPVDPGSRGVHDQLLDPLDRLRAIPETGGDLTGYYRYLLGALEVDQLAAVQLLAVCDFAVSAEELREILPTSAPSLGRTLESLAPVLSQTPGLGGLRMHHESLTRFILADADHTWQKAVRRDVVRWLSSRDYFSDTRAFRHLPELLVALEEDAQLEALVGPDFVARAVAGLQPVVAIQQVLASVARRCADRLDWPFLVRCVELQRTVHRYELDGLFDLSTENGDLLVALLGSDSVAASLLYDGRATFPVQFGLHLCAAVDAAGGVAPWRAYLDAWEDRDRTSDPRGHEEQQIHLAVQRGTLRVGATTRGRDGTTDPATSPPRASRLASHLAKDALPPLEPLLDVVMDVLGAPVVLEATRGVADGGRRARILLHLAVRASEVPGLPAPRDLAEEARAAAPAIDRLTMLRLGVPVLDLVGDPKDLAPQLVAMTEEVLLERSADRPEALEEWWTLLNLGYATDPRLPAHILNRLDGVGFYRAWLRFCVATVGLAEDLERGSTSGDGASTAVRLALAALAAATDPFSGTPRAVDLYSVHVLIHETFDHVLAFVEQDDLDEVVRTLLRISDRTTTSAMGLPSDGPMTIRALLALLSRHVDRVGAETVSRLMAQEREALQSSGAHYSELAAFELEMALVSGTAGDSAEARRCWERAARYLTCYGGHKDITLWELLDPLPTLAAVDRLAARSRLASLRPLANLAALHSDGRETSALPRTWWRLLAELDPAGAAMLGATVFLGEPGFVDGRVDEARRQLLHGLPLDADPVILAALRLSAGADSARPDDDLALLERLEEIPQDDPARSTGVLSTLVDSVLSSYDDRPLSPDSAQTKHGPSPLLRTVSRRLGAIADFDAEVGTDDPPSGSERELDGADLQRRLHSMQRPVLGPNLVGITEAVRDWTGRRYDDDEDAPRWSADALVNAVGYRLIEIRERDGADAALDILSRLHDELRSRGEGHILEQLAEGLALHTGAEETAAVVAVALTLAFTASRGGGGWLSFGGVDRLDLWRRAVDADPDAAARVLASRTVEMIEHRPDALYGVSQALVAALADRPPDRSTKIGFACWDAAFEVIRGRLPGSAHADPGAYLPGNGSDSEDLDTSFAALAVAGVALPERPDRRRALLAASVLLRSRPEVGQSAVAEALRAHLGAGPTTWLLAVLADGTTNVQLTAGVVDVLRRLAQSDSLSVRATASRILTHAGSVPPAPPATAAHPMIRRAVAQAFGAEG